MNQLGTLKFLMLRGEVELRRCRSTTRRFARRYRAEFLVMAG
jgi:hypothetical protein